MRSCVLTAGHANGPHRAMSGETWMLSWDEPDHRHDERSSDGRFIVSPYQDDDRWRYELTDTKTGQTYDHMYPNPGMAKMHAERILAEEAAAS